MTNIYDENIVFNMLFIIFLLPNISFNCFEVIENIIFERIDHLCICCYYFIAYLSLGLSQHRMIIPQIIIKLFNVMTSIQIFWLLLGWVYQSLYNIKALLNVIFVWNFSTVTSYVQSSKARVAKNLVVITAV